MWEIGSEIMSSLVSELLMVSLLLLRLAMYGFGLVG